MNLEASESVKQAEVAACKGMIAQVQDRFVIGPDRPAAEIAYDSA